MLDRGFIHAIAHVRGGREKGDRWYAQGRLLSKQNTFTDFIAATETLIAEGYADPRAVFAQGSSAGGLVMGTIANMRPDLYTGIVAEAPFVDVITTMSDPSVPLTTLEYEEWGNPAIKREYDYMLSYSPYDNVAKDSSRRFSDFCVFTQPGPIAAILLGLRRWKLCPPGCIDRPINCLRIT